MTEPLQTTRPRQLPTLFGVFTTFSDEILDVKRFAQVHWLKSLTLEGKCFRWRAKPAHIGGHLPEAERWGKLLALAKRSRNEAELSKLVEQEYPEALKPGGILFQADSERADDGIDIHFPGAGKTVKRGKSTNQSGSK